MTGERSAGASKVAAGGRVGAIARLEGSGGPQRPAGAQLARLNVAGGNIKNIAIAAAAGWSPELQGPALAAFQPDFGRQLASPVLAATPRRPSPQSPRRRPSALTSDSADGSDPTSRSSR